MSTDNRPLSYEALIRKSAQELVPISAQIELTHGCNLQCVHCFVGPGKANQEDLSTEAVFDVLNQLSDAGCLFLTLTGGEILVREDFFAIAEYAREKAFALRLLTNGTMITETTADRIARINPLSVEVSVYGARAEIHDSITLTPGSFQRTMSALELLQERHVPLIIKTPVMKTNIGEYREIHDMAEELGAGFICDPKIIPGMNGSKEALSLRIGTEELDKVVSGSGGKRENKFSHEQRLGLYICAAGRRTACISPRGDLFPCSLWRVPAGNLKKDSLKQIWRHSAFLQEVRALGLPALSKCARCEWLVHCSPCIGMGLLETNEPRADAGITCAIARTKERQRFSSH